MGDRRSESEMSVVDTSNSSGSLPPPSDVNKVEDILKSLGGYSTYQRWITFILIFPQFATAMIVLSPVFTGSSRVEIYCPTADHDYEVCASVNCTVPNGHETYTSVVQEWNLVCGKSWIADMVTSFQMAGMTVGAIVSSVLSDQYGRKKCFLVQTLCMGLLGMSPALAYNPWTYAVARFFAGFGVGACFVVYLSHLMEFLTPSWRTICGTISCWPPGEMCLALLAYLIGDWRWLTFATAVPALLLLPFYFMVLESPRWLLIHNRTEEAQEVFAKIAEWNHKPPPSEKEIEELQVEILKEESSSIHGIRAIKLICCNQKLRLHMLILILCNLTCSVVYYGVSFNAKNLSGDPYLNMVYMGIFDLFASPASVPFNNWIGRRKTFMMYMSLGTAFIVALLLIDVTKGINHSDPLLITILSLCGRFGIVAAWGALTCLILETAPTNLRSTCMGFAAFIGYLGGVLAPQLFLLGNVASCIPYIILCVLTISSSTSSWFIRETLQQPLEDTVEKDNKS